MNPNLPSPRARHRIGRFSFDLLRSRGLTLIELLVVLIILIGIAGILVTTLTSGARITGADGIQRTDNEIVTVATMESVREAMIGNAVGVSGYRQDVGQLPSRLAALVQNVDGESVYDPAIKRGWRGPYIVDNGSRYENYVDVASDNFDDDDGFPYGAVGDAVILDGWGKPLLLQEPTSDFARIVSAGENRVLETDPATALDANRGDDLVLFLLTSDPTL
ncbi:MAG: hypothetical protein AAGI48_03485 [Verrucomicrobiota bacterium]